MKLKLAEAWSYNGGHLELNEFAYVIGPINYNPTSEIKEIILPCRGGKYSNCVLRIKLGEPDITNHIFSWNGNKECPTIIPSIGCDHRCGWHGNVTNGEMLP